MRDARPSHVRYLVLAAFCALAALAYVHRNCLAVPAKQVAGDLKISEEDMAWVMSIFFWGYAIMQVPSGWAAWRLGSRVLVPILIVLWSVANGLIGVGLGLTFLLVCRILMGAAQAGLFPCAVQSFRHWFPLGERAMPSGYLAAFMSVGGALATALTAFLLEYMHWQDLMIVLGIPGIAFAILFFAWFRDTPREHAWVNEGELAVIEAAPPRDNAGAPPLPAPQWRELLLNPALFWVCLQQFCRAAAYIFYATWWPTFLQESRDMPVSESGYVGSLPLLGVVAGSAVGGQMMDWVYRRTGSLAWSRQGLAIITMVASALLMVLGYFAADVTLTVTCLTASCFFAGACGPAGYTITIDMGGKHVATIFSVMNMSGNIGAALFPVVALWVKNQGSWDDVLLLSAGLYGVAGLCWMLVGRGKGTASAAA